MIDALTPELLVETHQIYDRYRGIIGIVNASNRQSNHSTHFGMPARRIGRFSTIKSAEYLSTCDINLVDLRPLTPELTLLNCTAGVDHHLV